MPLMRWLIVLAVCVGTAAGLYLLLQPSAPTIPFARVRTAELTSTVVTNGVVEPVTASEIRSNYGGRVAAVLVAQGQPLSANHPLLHLDNPDAQSDLRDAEAALLAAKSRLHQVESGGSPLRRQELEGRLREAELTLQHAQSEAGDLRRLHQAGAATLQEAEAEDRKVALAAGQVAAGEAQLRALVSQADGEDARAGVVTAQARLEAARRRSVESTVRSPVAGILYEFSVKPGSWLQSGDLLGRVGSLESLRISVYVDEPELGRLAAGMPVVIRWDALPGQQWKGVIDRLPSRIQTFGTRQVGEVLCSVQNPDSSLLPGANVNAELITAQLSGALVIPKQAIRRRLGVEGVWKLDGEVIRWQPVRVGVSSVTEAQIVEGLSEGDSVALLVDQELREDLLVQAEYPN